MEKRRITYDNELEIMIEEYLANPLEAELERVIEGLEEEELAERRAKVQSVLEGRAGGRRTGRAPCQSAVRAGRPGKI